MMMRIPPSKKSRRVAPPVDVELAMLRQALSVMPHLAVVVIDLVSQRYVLAAGGLAHKLGYHSIVDQKWRDVVAPERQANVAMLLDEARRHRRYATHWASLARPGTVLHVVAYGTPADEPTHAVLVLTDREGALLELGQRLVPPWDPDDVSGFGQ